MKRKLIPLIALLIMMLGSLACEGGIDNKCTNILSGVYNTQECANVRNLEGIHPDAQACTTFLSNDYNTPECKQYRLDNPPTFPTPEVCSTCETATSGGQVMNPENPVQELMNIIIP